MRAGQRVRAIRQIGMGLPGDPPEGTPGTLVEVGDGYTCVRFDGYCRNPNPHTVFDFLHKGVERIPGVGDRVRVASVLGDPVPDGPVGVVTRSTRVGRYDYEVRFSQGTESRWYKSELELVA